MVVGPGVTPVTTPRLETVATDGAEEIQALETAAVPLPVRVKALPTQRVVFPVMVGFALTVTVAVFKQPWELVYVISEVPFETAVTNPVPFMVATAVVPEVHGVTFAGVGDPLS